MKKQIISSLLVLGMAGSAITNVAAAGSRSVNVLTAINYDANYLFHKTKNYKEVGAKASTQFTYNKKGLVASEKDNWPESIFRGQRNYTYNNQNKIVKRSGYMIDYDNKKNKYTDTGFVYKNGKLVSIPNYVSKMTYKGNRLVSLKNSSLKTKFSYNKKGQVITIKQFSAAPEDDLHYRYDSKGYLTRLSGAVESPITYKNTYRNNLLVRQNYSYKKEDENTGKKVTKKGVITYTYKKIRVSNALYNKVKAQQKALYFAGNGDYYAIGFTNYYFYIA